MDNRIIYHPLTATPFKRNSFYTELSSCKELRPYIRCYWGTENPLIQIENDDTPELVIPDTCVDIIYDVDYTNNTVTGGFCGINDCSFHAHNSGTIGHMQFVVLRIFRRSNRTTWILTVFQHAICI